MKKFFVFSTIVLVLMFGLLVGSCKTEDAPDVPGGGNNGNNSLFPSPTDVKLKSINGGIDIEVTWNFVSNAIDYQIYIKNTSTEQVVRIMDFTFDGTNRWSISYWDFQDLSVFKFNNSYKAGVMAVSAGGLYSDITWSESSNW